MKIDLVINNMIQQADRAAQSQQPQTIYRTGEVLQGRVLGPGAADGTVQIRLSSGALLNAVPAEGVLLNGGAVVTLRVSSQAGPKTMMQLLTQEADNRGAQAAVLLAQLQSEALLQAQPAAQQTAPGSLASVMSAMAIPVQPETLARAADIAARYPSLAQEQAVFLAANNIPATEENLATLARLLDGQDMAAQLQALSAALQSGSSAAAQQPAMTVLLSLNAQAAAQAAGAPTAQAQPAQVLVAQNPAAQAVEGQNNNIYDTQHDMGAGAGSMNSDGGRSAAAFYAAGQADRPSAAAPALAFPGHATEALQLQSLTALAMGDQGQEYAPLLATLQDTGLVGETVSRALDGMFRSGGNDEAEARAFSALLPPEAQEQGERFFLALTQGLRRELARMEAQQAPMHPLDPQTLAAEIDRLIVSLGGQGDAAEKLQQAVAQQRPAVEQLAAQAQSAAPQDAAVQLRGIAENLKMIADISQYAYQQIPVKMGDTPRTVDLYVMKRGKGRRIDPENASILIALNTENLGRLETLIHVNHRSLRLRVGVADSGVGEYIESYSREWGEAMEAIGFRLADLRMQVTERPVTPLNAQAEAAPPASGGLLDLTL